VGLSVSMLFIAFMLVSNWMGSPEFRVESSAEQEVAAKLLPQEGPSTMLGVPYEFMAPGTYLPGQIISGNPYLTAALQEFEDLMFLYSCTVTGSERFEPCDVQTLPSGDKRYGNFFKPAVMVDPYAELRVTEIQPGLAELKLYFRVEDPENPGQLLVDETWIKYRHATSGYEEECRYINKPC
jgi:hypothetical protein